VTLTDSANVAALVDDAAVDDDVEIVETIDEDGGRRELAVTDTGDPDGYPVFLMHGTPGSRVGLKPRYSVLYRLGVRLISYDRPGYGFSSRRRGRRIKDSARDVAAIADSLKLENFAVVGRSGGGPHALAAAALLPQRVTGLAVLVSLAPADAAGLDWYEGMVDTNVDDYTCVDQDESALLAGLRARAQAAFDDPASFIQFLDKQAHLTESDRRVVEDIAIRRQLKDTYHEAFRQGPDGWVDDLLAARQDWGFDLASIDAPTKLWHGCADQFSPALHTQWLFTKIRGAEVELDPQAGHFGAVEVLPRMLAWAARQAAAAEVR
jgi:pimeloyl-ACP methyl ester carboxylesterase